MSTEAKNQAPAIQELAPAPSALKEAESSLMSVATMFFSEADKQADTIIAKFKGVVWEKLETVKGMDAAVKARAELRTFRTGVVDKGHAAIKAPLLAVGRLADDSKKKIGDKLKDAETVIDDVIKTEEQRKSSEKAERERIERERINGIRENITAIRMMPTTLVGKSSAVIRERLEQLVDPMTLPDEFAELIEEAGLAYKAASESIETMLQAAVAHEAEQERLAEERAQLERDRLAREEQEAAVAAKLAQERKALEDEQEAFRKKQAAAKPAEVAVATPSPLEAPAAAEASKASSHADFDTRELDEVFGSPTQSSFKPASAATARPSNKQIVMLVANHWNVSEATAYEWLMTFDKHTEAA